MSWSRLGRASILLGKSGEMIFTETGLKGAYLIELEPIVDKRGYLARSFCVDEFDARGLSPTIAQCNLSLSYKKGTLRGLHYQVSPESETKLVRCIAGAIFDVIVDLRPGSATYLGHYGIELSAENRRMLYIPELFAHGFQTLVDDTEVFYQMGNFYAPDCQRGLRYDDPLVNIRWPLPVTEIAEKDLAWPLLEKTQGPR